MLSSPLSPHPHSFSFSPLFSDPSTQHCDINFGHNSCLRSRFQFSFLAARDLGPRCHLCGASVS
jgi:hypothetical protein